MTSKPLTNVDVRYLIEATRQQVMKEFTHFPIGAPHPEARVEEMADEIVRLRAKVQWLEAWQEAEREGQGEP